ncbi:Uncharacterised protein [Vibrio cholerae]|nr:hypothetical protein VCHC20A2_0230 [Vibrio cholerae HC-20A2]EKG49012.1 hypothetical protein VCHC39A1_0216 [Vibrio cholerae HC-39A1]EKG55502.1 hypothetical protein VCHC41A1_0227 [Vibrio cholerae HC-41A1]EMQ35567.1 hypothetical protein VCEM1546_000217 [Vibrio cholerae O1 str. EM-1546]EMQ49798.1 hypothetical protein VCPCS023_000130 [Vibrio cholerae O1 str. PCS-023]CSB67361.1 Uncharacterised protein [Vibrio cholerae]
MPHMVYALIASKIPFLASCWSGVMNNFSGYGDDRFGGGSSEV